MYNYDLVHAGKQSDNYFDPYLVVSLDVLGFSNGIMNDRAHFAFQEDVFTLLSEMKCIADDMDSSFSLCHAFFFSDSIFLFFKLDYSSRTLFEFEYFVSCLTRIVFTAMKSGFLVRGGMCIGECWINGDIMWGPGIIKAHHLENKIADSARIVIEENDYNQLEKYFEYIENDSKEKLSLNYFIKEFGSNYFAFDSIGYILQRSLAEYDPNEAINTLEKCLSSVRNKIYLIKTEPLEIIQKYLGKLKWPEERLEYYMSLIKKG